MNISWFGSSLVSAYWNGACTYYRGVVRALAQRGHHVTFYEPDALDRQRHRDIPDPEWARVVVYDAPDARAVRSVVQRAAADTEVLIKSSGVGVHDEVLEAAVLDFRRSGLQVVFWDVDAPATLGRVEQVPEDPLRALVPEYDLVLTYGGGERVVRRYEALGAPRCVPIYNALDPETHHPAAPEERFRADLSLLVNRLPDREGRVREFFFAAVEALPRRRFLLAGAGWEDSVARNLSYLGPLPPSSHNAFNSSPLAVLNVTRDSMVENGWSPATRVFEAAGAGACLISDSWEGLEQFLEPGSEVIACRTGAEVVVTLQELDPATAHEIGLRAHERVLDEHTYGRRAWQVEEVLSGRGVGVLA